MKNCRKVQRELSAYLDGELTPSLRAEVEAHLASCAHCQRELLEMKMLATGVAALPNLKPAPRFLTEVRRKIARGEKPEPWTWQDYAFRPFWLKVPLEVAALIVIIGLVLRGVQTLPTVEVAQLEPVRTENRENGRLKDVSSEPETKTAVADALKSTVADRAPAAEAYRDGSMAPGVRAELSPSRKALEKEEKDIGAPETHGLAVNGDKKQSVDQLTASGMPASGVDSQPAGAARRIPAFHNSDELSATPPSSPSPVLGASRSMEFAQSKPGETVTVHARNFDDVRSRAQQLAARCNGRVVVVPPSKDATEQTFFVELPREYVAAFKLELLKTSGPSATLAQGGTGEQSASTDAAVPSSGVLTGNAATNNSINAPGPLGLGDDATASAPTAVLEIRVVAPAN